MEWISNDTETRISISEITIECIKHGTPLPVITQINVLDVDIICVQHLFSCSINVSYLVFSLFFFFILVLCHANPRVY